MNRSVAAAASIPLTPAQPRQGLVRPECPRCGIAWSPSCPNATLPSWDPTRGVTSTTWQPIGGRR